MREIFVHFSGSFWHKKLSFIMHLYILATPQQSLCKDLLLLLLSLMYMEMAIRPAFWHLCNMSWAFFMLVPFGRAWEIFFLLLIVWWRVDCTLSAEKSIDFVLTTRETCEIRWNSWYTLFGTTIQRMICQNMCRIWSASKLYLTENLV